MKAISPLPKFVSGKAVRKFRIAAVVIGCSIIACSGSSHSMPVSEIGRPEDPIAGELPSPGAMMIYRVGADFSAKQNPNGVWRYGYAASLDGKLILYDVPSLYADGRHFWIASAFGGSVVPSAQYNPVDNPPIPKTIAPGGFALHPGPGGEYSEAVFTAPRDGSYDISGYFGGADPSGTTTDVHVVIKGQPVFDSEVTGSMGVIVPFPEKVAALKSGETVMFAVGFGDNKNYLNDTTLLSATIKLLDQ